MRVISFFDTSALVPLLVPEPSTPDCVSAWRESHKVYATRITYVEVAAALGSGIRRGRVNAGEIPAIWAAFELLAADIEFLAVDDGVVMSAAALAFTHQLRGYDAVQCASALIAAEEPDLVAVSGDRALVAAWQQVGIATILTAA